MKWGIAAEGKDLDSMTAERFARAPWLLVVEGGAVIEAIESPAAELGHGAGTHVVQLLADRSVDGVLARQVGPKAAEALRLGGLKVWQVDGGTVRAAVESAEKGELKAL